MPSLTLLVAQTNPLVDWKFQGNEFWRFFLLLLIILLTLPLFWPIAKELGTDPFAFAVFGILAIEAGLLTPPFGLLVYTVKGAVPDPSVKLGEIFKGSVPYWLLMLVAMVLVWVFPVLATALHKKPVRRTEAPPVPVIQVEAAAPEWHLLRL